MSTIEEKQERITRYMESVFNEKKPYAFISYSHEAEDKEKVYSLLEKLMKKGINFAIDTEYPGLDGSWIDGMFKRVKHKNCKSMLSFFSKTYMYSRPSLLEQFMRYAPVVQQAHEDSVFSCIYISLFGMNRDIKTFLQARDEKTPQEIKNRKVASLKRKLLEAEIELEEEEYLLQVTNDYRIEPSSDLYKHLTSGLRAYVTDELMFEDYLKRLGDIEDIKFIREMFYHIAKRENKLNNVNLFTEEDNILAMLKQNGVLEDAEIKEKALKLFEEDKTAAVPVKQVEISAFTSVAKEESPEKQVIKTTSVPDVKASSELTKPAELSATEIYLWTYQNKKGTDAVLEWDGISDTCVVRKGSKAAAEAEKFVNVKSAYALKRRLEQEKILVNDIFQEDYTCNAMASVLNLLVGGSVSRPQQMESGLLVKAAALSTGMENPGTRQPEKVVQTAAGTMQFNYQINTTDAKYNIITLGVKGFMGFDETVIVRCNGTEYVKTTHKTAKGRIDGFKEIYAQNDIVEGDWLAVTCDYDNKVITLEKKDFVEGFTGDDMQESQIADTVEDLIRSAGLSFLGIRLEDLIRRAAELEDKAAKAALVQEYFENQIGTKDSQIGGVRTRVNAAVRIMKAGKVEEVLNMVAGATTKVLPEAVAAAKEALRKIQSGELALPKF